MTVKELLRNGQNPAAPVHLIVVGDAEISEPVFDGERDDAIKSRYAEYEVAAWEAACSIVSSKIGIIVYIEERGRTF